MASEAAGAAAAKDAAVTGSEVCWGVNDKGSGIPRMFRVPGFHGTGVVA